MKCRYCESQEVVKHGSSRHGTQRWLCRSCGRTGGEKDHRRVEPAKRASALADDLEGVGLRATERLVGDGGHRAAASLSMCSFIVRLSGGDQVRLQRLFFSKLAHAHDAEPDDVTLGVHALHHGIVVGFLFVASSFREADFQEVRLGIKPDF